MTFTPEQLDELEAKARAASSLLSSVTSVFVPAATAIHLVAVYRAAMAWRDARWKHNDAALAHGLLSPAARAEFAVLDELAESLDAAVRGRRLQKRQPLKTLSTADPATSLVRACSPTPPANDGQLGEYSKLSDEELDRYLAELDRLAAVAFAEKQRRLLAQMTDHEKHVNQCHPEWEYAEMTTGRKSGISVKPDGDGWEPNMIVACHIYKNGAVVQEYWRNWDRFDYHEVEYWRRRKVTP